MKKLLKRIVNAVQNRKKPTLGAIAWGVTYVVCRLALSMDDITAAGTATTVSLIVVERVGPIFGIDVDGPTVEQNGQVVVEVNKKAKLAAPERVRIPRVPKRKR